MDIESVLHELTLSEKCSLVTGADFWHIPGIDRLGIKPFSMSDGPHGLRKQGDQADNLGINGSDPAICYPTASAAACSFDVDLIYAMGEALGDECRAQDVSMILGPGVNMKRSPLCGRNFEYYSEDPYLAGHLGAAYINGVQSRGVGASLKHFCANNQEKNRLIVDSVIDDCALHEVYLRPFEIAIRAAQPWTVMTAYNLLNGTYCSENEYLMGEIARDTWGFEGAFVTDWGALNSNTASLPAGLDLVMPGPRLDYLADLAQSVESGKTAKADLDQAVRRVLDLMVKRDEGGSVPSVFSVDEGLSLARKIARESAVLLENDGTLPLDGKGSHAIIGAFAKTPRYQGAGSSKIEPISLDCAFDAFIEAGVECEYEQAYDVATGVVLDGGVERAVALAAQSGTAIVFVGLPDSTESEGSDRETMDMPVAHIELIERVSAVNPRTVVVLQGGSPVSMPWRTLPAAVLLCYLGGCQGGHAAVDLLLGSENPSGKLAETWPLSLTDSPAAQWYPAAGRQALYVESIYIGYRYYDTAGVDVAYPFGYGRSYTTFEYRDMSVSHKDERVTVTCVVENTGDVFGKEAVQLYIAPMHSKALKPYQELKGFKKVALGPHEHVAVSFDLDRDAFSHFDPRDQAWHVGTGEYELRIAASSRDVRLAFRTSIEGDELAVTGSANSGLDSEEGERANTAFDEVPQAYRTPHQSRFTIDAFKTLYGKSFPKSLTAMRPYTINSTIADLQTSSIGKIVVYFINRELKNLLRDKPNERELMSATILDIPLRNVAMSGIDMLFVYGIVDVLNYHFVRGFKKIVFKRDMH